jgi:hypothetical protein
MQANVLTVRCNPAKLVIVAQVFTLCSAVRDR